MANVSLQRLAPESVHCCGPSTVIPETPWDELELEVQSEQVSVPTVPEFSVPVHANSESAASPFSSTSSALNIVPATISETRSANGWPSVRTKPRAVPSLALALSVEVESQALNVPDRPAPLAAAAQSASAPL